MSNDDRKAYAEGDIRSPQIPGGQNRRPQREQMPQEKRKRKRRHERNKAQDNRDALRRYHTKYKRKRKMKQRREKYRENPERYERKSPRKYERPDKTAVAQRYATRPIPVRTASRRIRKSFVLNRIYDHIHDREGIEEGSAHVISKWGSHEWLVSYLTYAGEVRKVLVGGYNTADGVFLSVRPFRLRSAGDVMLYDQHNPANNEIKQPGKDVNYRAEGPTTYTKEPDEKKGIVPGGRVPSRQLDNAPPASSRVIPDSMKQTLSENYMKSAAATVPQILSNCGSEVTGRSSDIKYKRKRLSPSGMSTWIAQSVTDPGKQYTIRVKPIRKDKRLKVVAKMPVRVSCSCPFWRWQGPEHWGKVNDYLYGKPRGTASFPIIRDPKSKHWACKHVIAVLQLVKNYRYASAEESKWSYDGPLAPLPDEGRVAVRYMEAKRQLWWHGTAGKNLRSILKQGLIPTGDLVYDIEIDQNRAGGRSIKTFGGIYFSSQWYTAYSAAGQANPGRRMPRVIIGATLDNRSPDVLLDEDDMLQGIENVMGRTFDEVARQIRLPEGSVDSWGTPKVGAYGTINRFLLEDADYGDLPSLYLDRMMSMYPKLEGRVERQREALEAAVQDVLATYAAHLLETLYHRFKDKKVWEIRETIEDIPKATYYDEAEKQERIAYYEEQLKQHLADERKIKGSFQLLQKATNRLGRMMREATEMPENAFRHNIRTMRPVTYRGKDRILMVASITDRDSQVWEDAGQRSVTATDIIFHYGAQHRKPFIDKYEERVGGIARVLDASGKVLEILDLYGDLEKRGWPTDIWGPAPRAYRDVAASDNG